MRRRLATLLAVGALLSSMLIATGNVLGASQGASLSQCANDPAPSPPTNGCAGVAGENGWVNGNLGSSKSIYREGDSIPYRLQFSSLAGGTSLVHTVTIEWDTTKSGKHAIDYLRSTSRPTAPAAPSYRLEGDEACLGANLGCCALRDHEVGARTNGR